MHLAKHHALGNDFLVTFDEPASIARDWSAVARRLCRRRRGVGADGLIVATDGGPDGAELTMALYNADGSSAEISGNGIRCLAQAEVRRRDRHSATLRIATAAGLRTCAVTRGTEPASVEVSVGMGKVTPGPEPAGNLPGGDAAPHLGLDATRRLTVAVGNPHWVVEVPRPEVVDRAEAGPLHESVFPGGINVHFMAAEPGPAGAITIATWERGAGATEACGSGACAAAAVATGWGLVTSPVTVHMAGGRAQVTLDGDEVTLVGPASYIATVEVE